MPGAEQASGMNDTTGNADMPETPDRAKRRRERSRRRRQRERRHKHRSILALAGLFCLIAVMVTGAAVSDYTSVSMPEPPVLDAVEVLEPSPVEEPEPSLPEPSPTPTPISLTITDNPSSPMVPGDIYSPSPLSGEQISYQRGYIPVYEGTEPLQVEPGDFAWGGDRMYYTGDKYEVIFGVDVSAHQNQDRRDGILDWEAAKADGVSFVMIRAGARGYSEGSLIEDPYCIQNIEGAMAAGIITGIYFFSQAVTIEEAVEEADYVIDLVAGHEFNGPVCFDWETYNASYRTYRVSPDMATACAVAFCRRVAAAGYTPMVYTDRSISYRKHDQGALAEFMCWYPQYPAKNAKQPCPTYYYHVDMWQFTDRCVVDGIGRRIDGNLWIREKG